MNVLRDAKDKNFIQELLNPVTGQLDAANVVSALQYLDQRSDALLQVYRSDPSALSTAEQKELAVYLGDYASREGAVAAQALLRNGSGQKADSGDVRDLTLYAQSLQRANAQQEAQAALGGPALQVLAGPVGTIARAVQVAQSSTQIGAGIAALGAGETGQGLMDVGLGLMGLGGAGAAQLVVTGTRTSPVANVVGKVNGETRTPVTSGGTANGATAPKLSEQLSNESLAASGANINNIQVVAEGKINGQVYIDTNQTARSTAAANASEFTLVPADRVSAREVQGLGNVNGNMATAHAEVGVIEQASKVGVARGADMTLTVKGMPVCDFCRGDIPAAARAAGLKSLTIIDVEAGVTYYWSPGMVRIKPK